MAAEFNLKAMLTKKLGPLPAWGWGLVIGGGYLGYRVLSGKGLSLTGSEQAATENTAYPEEGAGAGYSYGEGGAAPINIYIDNPPSADNEDLAAQLAASKAYAQKMKTRGNNWANYARRWRNVAKRKGDAQNAKGGSTAPKTGNNQRSKRTGTQGTQLVPYVRSRSPIDRSQGWHTRPRDMPRAPGARRQGDK